MRDGRSAAGEDDFSRTSFPRHADNLPAGRAADDGVVNQTNHAALKLRVHGTQFPAHTLLASLLSRQNERPIHVSVLDKSVGKRLAKLLRDNRRGRVARLRDGNDHVDVVDAILSKRVLELLGQLDAHVLSALVDRDAIHDRVGPGKVDVLEDVRRVGQPLGNLVELRLATLLDEDRLTGENVAHVLEAQLAKRNALGCQHVVGAALDGGGGPAAHDERSDAIRIPEGKDAKAGDHGRHGPCALALLIRTRQSLEDVVNIHSRLAGVVEGVGENVEHQLAVGVGVDMAVSLLVEEAAQLWGVCDVAVMGEANLISACRAGLFDEGNVPDAVRRVDVEWLRLGALCGSQ